MPKYGRRLPDWKEEVTQLCSASLHECMCCAVCVCVCVNTVLIFTHIHTHTHTLSNAQEGLSRWESLPENEFQGTRVQTNTTETDVFNNKVTWLCVNVPKVNQFRKTRKSPSVSSASLLFKLCSVYCVSFDRLHKVVVARGRYCVKDNCPQLIIEASGLFTQCHVTSRVSEVSWNRRLLSVSDISHMWLICTVTALVGLSCWSSKKVHSIQSPPSIASYFTLCTGEGLNVQKSDSSSLSLCCREKTQMIYYSFFLVHFDQQKQNTIFSLKKSSHLLKECTP